MPGACPAPQPGDPLVESLLSSTDCHVQTLVRSGYDALFAPSGAFASVLTVGLTIYVALIGYRLLLGRSQLNVSELALSAVKIGAVVALATQWGTYQTVVYRTLFDGPQETADVIMHSVGASGSAYAGDVFVGLQRAFDDLTSFSPASPPGAAAAAPTPPPAAPAGLTAASPIAGTLPPASTPGAGASNLLSQSGFDSLLLLGSALILLISTLGVLLIAKIVLALLLGLGPIFLALFLFDTTRGLFEGWLRASIAFAFAPLTNTLTLGVGLVLLTPSLGEIETMRDTHTYTPGVAFGVLILVIVLAGVSLGLSIAVGVIAAGFKLPRLSVPSAGWAGSSGPPGQPALATLSEPARAERVATAAASQERRDAAIFARSGAAIALSDDRRGASTAPRDRTTREIVTPDVRLGQAPRRNAQPRLGRGLRSEA